MVTKNCQQRYDSVTTESSRLRISALRVFAFDRRASKGNATTQRRLGSKGGAKAVEGTNVTIR